MSELRKIPNVGEKIEQDLIAMGYTTPESLKGKTAQQLYQEECALRGCLLDRCQLYLYRAVEYYINTPAPELARCKWWYWKDEYVEPAPCGAVCVRCKSFPTSCKGCRQIRGKAWWLPYIQARQCPVYDCCVTKKGMINCGSCPELPCGKFAKDPTISDEENEANLRGMLERLRKATEGANA